MTNKEHNAVDEHGFHHLTKAEVEQQTKYLDSLPKDEQMRIAAKACGMSVVDFLLHIAALHGDMQDADEGVFNEGGVPFAEPIIFEYIEPKKK